jgi:hypothetical protein
MNRYSELSIVPFDITFPECMTQLSPVNTTVEWSLLEIDGDSAFNFDSFISYTISPYELIIPPNHIISGTTMILQGKLFDEELLAIDPTEFVEFEITISSTYSDVEILYVNNLTILAGMYHPRGKQRCRHL